MSDNNFRKGPHTAKNKPASEVKLEDIAMPSVDERKTVILDEDLEGVEFEDKVWLYWNRNKNFIITTVLAAFAIVICVQGWKIYSANRAAQLSQAYEAAVSDGKLDEFATQNSGTALAGVALLHSADAAYASAKYADAQKLYSNAQADLSNTIILGRAKLGAAVSTYSAGDKAKGEAQLKAVLDDHSLADAYRSQAGYLLGLAQKQDGKIAEAKATLKQVAEMGGNGIFARISQEALSQIE